MSVVIQKKGNTLGRPSVLPINDLNSSKALLIESAVSKL